MTSRFTTIGLKVAIVAMIIQPAWAGEATMRKVAYAGWPNCVELTNGKVKLVATTDVGPRIMHFGFVDGQNVFKHYKDMLGRTGDKQWNIYGGHRLWHAPEHKPRTYYNDNFAIRHAWDGRTLRLMQPTEPATGIEKHIEMTLDPDAAHVTVVHRLINRNAWPVQLAPWALSVMAPGGRAIVPQEPFIKHEDKLLPARNITLWHYSDMNDARFAWGTKYIQVAQDTDATQATKFGCANTLGWAAYVLGGDVFVKRFKGHSPDAIYPDLNSNTEVFTNQDMLEVETLGPLTKLKPGEHVEHIEHWFLFRANVGRDEASIDTNLLPLVHRAGAHVGD